jgi:tetratricopeptide (TPR) repeat protein
MKLSRLIIVLSAVLFISSCTVSKQVKQLNYDAETAYQAGDYQLALNSYEELISLRTDRNKKVEGLVYQKAGLAAWEIEEAQKAIDYLEKAKQTSAVNSKTLATLAKAYLKIDNLSREINNLEEYVEKYPQGEELNEVNRQLFIAYIESTNWDLAKNLWPSLDSEYHSDPRVMDGYLKLNRQLGESENLVDMARQLLKIEPNNLEALEVLAQEFYKMAEDSYQKEMRAYERNKTTRQYRQLLKELEVINANFKTSRDYFERLYKLDPNPRYATFLGNIYTRFDNKKQANYYYKKAKE